MKRTPLARTSRMTRTVPLSSASRARPRAERIAGSKGKGNPIPPKVRQQVRERSAGQCELRAAADCSFAATEQHHRQRRREGGHPLSSVVDSCGACHRYAHGHPQQARDRGWIVSAFAPEPELEPVRYGDPTERMTWFLNDGTKTTAYITP